MNYELTLGLGAFNVLPMKFLKPGGIVHRLCNGRCCQIGGLEQRAAALLEEDACLT